MTWSRLCVVVVLLGALGVAAAKSTSAATRFPFSPPCNASALTAPYTGPLKVQSVDSFGCVGSWAYLWATIGSGTHQFGVTEVTHFNVATARWTNASRLTYCNHRLLPKYVELWGCNSN
jgi:hypothetical protein